MGGAAGLFRVSGVHNGNRMEVRMSVAEVLQASQFLVDADGKKQAVVIDYSVWEQLVTILEDLEDAEEIRNLRESQEEGIPWEQAKEELRAEGIDV